MLIFYKKYDRGIKMKKNIVIICIGMLLTIPLISATVIANEPPETPTIDGPTSGKPGVSHDYTFMSVDPDGDDVYYMVSWGCCGPGADFHEYGPFESGVETTISKTYDEEGTYTISAYAKDINDAESDIATLEVTMPVRYNMIRSMFLNFLDQHPRMFPILRNFLGL